KQVLPSISTALPDAPYPADALEEGADPVESSELRHFQIGADLHGQRLDRALVALAPEFSRSYLQQLLALGAVQLQGQVVTKAAATVRAGAAGSIELRPTPQSQAFRPEPMALSVVYEDEHLRIIDKPA